MMACFAIFFDKSEKADMPTRNTGYIIDVAEESLYNTTVPKHMTPPTTGSLPFFITFLAPAFSLLGDEIINQAAMWLLAVALLPTLMVIKRLIAKISRSEVRLFQARGRVRDEAASDNTRQPTLPEATTAEEVEDDEWFDAEEPQPSSGENTNNAQVSLVNEEALADLQAAVRRNGRFMGTLRSVLDPRGLYPPTTDIVVVANDVSKDVNRLSKQVERQREALRKVRDREKQGPLAQKDEQILELTTANSKLSQRVANLTVEAEWAKTDSEDVQRKLKERASQAERIATDGTIPLEAYRAKLTEIHDLQVAVTNARQETEDAKKEGEITIQGLRDERTDVQSTIRSPSDTQERSLTNVEEQAEKTRTENERKLELELAIQNARDAEEKMKAAEDKVAQNATAVSTLEQSLQEARDQAKNWRESNEEMARELQRTLEALQTKDGEAKPDAVGNDTNEIVITEINSLRSQLSEADDKVSEAFHNGFLMAMSQNQPIDQSEEAAQQSLSDFDQQNGSFFEVEELRGQIELLTAANMDFQLRLDNRQAESNLENQGLPPVQGPAQASQDEMKLAFQQGYAQALTDNPPPNVQDQIEKALAGERLDEQLRLGAAEVQKEQEVREDFERRWATESENFWRRIRATEAEIERLSKLGSEVEGELNRTKQDLSTTQQELTSSKAMTPRQTNELASEREKALQEELKKAVQRAMEAEDKFNNPEGALKEAQNHIDQLHADGQKEWERAQAAEAEIEKYKQGKASQDGRIKKLNDDILVLRKKKSPLSELHAAECQATLYDRLRASALVEEMINRHYDHPSRNVASQLMVANTKINNLKVLLKKSATKFDQVKFLTILLDGEVNEQYKDLEASKRVVLVKQCAGVNAKLMALKAMINATKEPDKQELQTELYKPRGDEMVLWNEDDFSESEMESDEDEDENSGSNGNRSSASASSSNFQPRPLPTRRNRPTPSAEEQNVPMSGNPDSNNSLKRKGNGDDNEPDGSSKRHDSFNMNMRPIAGPSAQLPQQGSSFPEADDDLDETKMESQDDLPFVGRIGDATAPQTQSDHWSRTPSQAEHALHPKPTKIPGPKPKASQTPSERQERQLVRRYEDNTALLAPQNAASPTAEGPTVFSFNAPKDIASGILPHVRKYTRLSGTTNTVLSRRRLNPNTAKP